MGADKALQSWQGHSFISYILKASLATSNKTILVSSKKAHNLLNYECVKDIAINKGPVSGITSALTHSKTSWNLILSCDVPLLESSFLHWLREHFNPNYDATVCMVNQKKMPLTSIYHNRCKAIFNNHLKKNQLRVMEVLKDLNVNYIDVPVEFHRQLTNVNTPEQLKLISL